MSQVMNIGNTLPSKIEDLAKFVLIGREQLNMVRAGIKALDKLDIAKDVREQKKDEAQMLAEALMDAEVRIGEILLAMPRASGKHWEGKRESKIDTAVDFTLEPTQPLQTKEEAVKQLGFDKKQAERFQTLAQHQDIVEQVKQEARANDDLATRTAVLQALKFKQVEEKKELQIEKKKEYEQRIETISVNEFKVDIFNTKEKFRVIYADPAWSYNDKQDTPQLGGAAKHYSTMTVEEICKLPVNQISEKDSVLFLWVTSPLLEDAFTVIKRWGFKYKTSFVWDKVKHNMGHYNSVRHEFLLIATKGSCTPDNKTLYNSVQTIERNDNHSEKPIEFLNIIDNLYNYGNKLEMFCRHIKKEKWYGWGNEI